MHLQKESAGSWSKVSPGRVVLGSVQCWLGSLGLFCESPLITELSWNCPMGHILGRVLCPSVVNPALPLPKGFTSAAGGGVQNLGRTQRRAQCIGGHSTETDITPAVISVEERQKEKGVLLKKLTNPDLRGITSPEQEGTEHLNSAACNLGSIPRASSSVLRLQTPSAGCSQHSQRAASVPPQLTLGKNRSSPLGFLFPAPGPCSSCASPPWCCWSRGRGLAGGFFSSP